jgi:tetratricopeptide (TPR) repeat protein
MANHEDTHDTLADGKTVFLSYNSSDREPVSGIRDFLRGRRIATFLDRDNLLPGRLWFDGLQGAIERAGAFIIFIGPSGQGVWQKREMVFALDRQARLEKSKQELLVIPILLPGADLDQAPSFLLLNGWIDLRQGANNPASLDALARAVAGDGTRPADAPESSSPCPYRGLYAFREEDEPLFFGRDAYSEDLLRKTLANPLVAVVGSSGSGKSSVVQAGLIPRLRRQAPPSPTWDAITFKPGNAPFHNLAAALASTWTTETDPGRQVLQAEEIGTALADGKARVEAFLHKALEARQAERLLVVVDQFEELFVQTPESLRRRFVEALLASAGNAPVTVVITLRDDFYGQALKVSRDLNDRLPLAQVNLGQMTREELRQAIERPAAVARLGFEPGLVERILDHVEGQPGNLPLLEFALRELWDGRRGSLLGNARYDAMGGIEGAISKRADEIFLSLPATQQRAVQRLFNRLVHVSAANEEGTDTRQRVRLMDLDEAARTAAQTLAGPGARLLVTSRESATGAETVEVAHEALLRSWGRLREWIGADRDFLLWRQRLARRVEEWQQSGRDAGALLRGAALQEAQRRAKGREGDLSRAELEMIRGSQAAARRPRRLLVAAAVSVTAVAAVGYLSLAAWHRTARYQVGVMVAEAPDIKVDSEVSGILGWADALAVSGRTEDAITFARGQSKEDVKAAALAAIARRVAQRGDPARACAILGDCLEAARNSPDNVMSTTFSRIISSINMLSARGRPDLAVPLLDGIRSSDLQKVPPGNNQSIVAYGIARAYIAAGQTDTAHEILTSLLPVLGRNLDNSWRIRFAEDLHRLREQTLPGALLSEAEREARDAEANPKRYVTQAPAHFMSIANAYRILGLPEKQKAMVDAAITAARKMEARRITTGDADRGYTTYFFEFDAPTVFITGLTKNGRPDAADEFVNREGNAWMRIALLAAVATELSNKDAAGAKARMDLATEEARRISDGSEKVVVLTTLAGTEARLGDRDGASRLTDEALAEARALPERYVSNKRKDFSATKASQLARIALILDLLGRGSDAAVVAHEAEKASRYIAGNPSSSIPRISEALARVGDYSLAREVADRALKDDRLQAFAAVMKEIAKRQDPEVDRLLQEDEREAAAGAD